MGDTVTPKTLTANPVELEAAQRGPLPWNKYKLTRFLGLYTSARIYFTHF